MRCGRCGSPTAWPTLGAPLWQPPPSLPRKPPPISFFGAHSEQSHSVPIPWVKETTPATVVVGPERKVQGEHLCEVRSETSGWWFSAESQLGHSPPLTAALGLGDTGRPPAQGSSSQAPSQMGPLLPLLPRGLVLFPSLLPNPPVPQAHSPLGDCANSTECGERQACPHSKV